MRAAGNLWAIPMLCLGLGLLACAVLIPAAAESRELRHRRDVLQADLGHLQLQVARNAELLGRLGQDAELAKRLERRQLNRFGDGAVAVDLERRPSPFDRTPFTLAQVADPDPVPLATMPGGRLAAWCLAGRGRLVVIGLGGTCVLIGLLFGGSGSTRD